MTFPKRWLDDDGANGAVRDVLGAGRNMDPPAGAEDAVWLALAGKIAAGAVVTAAATKTAAAATAKTAATATTATATAGATGSAATAVATGGLFKSILIGAFSGVVAVTGYSAITPSSPGAPPQGTAAIVAPAPTKDRSQPAAPRGAEAPAKTPGADDTASPATNHAAPSTSAAQPSSTASGIAAPDVTAEPAPASTDASLGSSGFAPGSPEERASRLREESDMLNQARAALRGGDVAGTMRLLNDAQKKFPGGVLGQEREALGIEALAKSGAREEASRKAAAFIQAHPNSPHAARLQVFVTP